jgi:hypothetical protein
MNTLSLFPLRLGLNLFTICLMAFVLRLVWALIIPVIPVSDSAAYDTFAQNIWLHGTYGWQANVPTSYWPVGTAAIYSVFYSIFGHVYWPITLFNIICGLVVIVYTALLCDRFLKAGSSPAVKKPSSISLYAALLVALCPTLIFFTTVLASELPYMAFLLAAFYTFTHDENRGVFTVGIVAGVLFSIAYYIRPLAIIPLAIGIFSLFFITANLRIILGRTLLVSVTLALLVAPWAYRNYQLYNAFVPMSTNGGATLWMGNHPGTNGGYADLPEKVAGLDEHSRDQVLKQDAIDYIKQEPLVFVVRTVKKFVQFHTRETIGVTWNEPGLIKRVGDWVIMPLKLVTQAFWIVILLLGLAGMIWYVINKGLWQILTHPFFLLWASTAGIHSIIVSQDRYHIPVIPLVIAFAAYCIDQLLARQSAGTAIVKD